MSKLHQKFIIKTIINGYNEYQKKAAEYNEKHLLVLAGAGTGKTKTIIARAEFLIKSDIQPNKIAILSFTRKSAQEIVERVKSSVSGQFGAGAISGRTFHSWCNEIMHTYPDYLPIQVLYLHYLRGLRECWVQKAPERYNGNWNFIPRKTKIVISPVISPFLGQS